VPSEFEDFVRRHVARLADHGPKVFLEYPSLTLPPDVGPNEFGEVGAATTRACKSVDVIEYIPG